MSRVLAHSSMSAELPTVRFVILQGTPFCNIDCTYCYLPDRSTKASMAVDTVRRAISELCRSGWLGDELGVLWHAGEPLVLPLSYYEQAFQIIAELVTGKTKVTHTIQTNGTLIDDAWCAFLKKHAVTLGVSIDGPEWLHDARRKTRAGGGTFAQTMKGIRRLQHHDVPFSVICVLTRESLGHASDLYQFFSDEGLANLCFNIEEVEGANTTSSLSGNPVDASFESFMREFWNLNVSHNRIAYIREFSNMLDNIVRPKEDRTIRNSLVDPLVTISIDYAGNYSTFSPELLGQKNAHYNDFILGNVWDDGGLAKCLTSEAFERIVADVRAGTDACRETCPYFSLCGGGSPVNKLNENGSFHTTETMYCRLTTKIVANLAMEVIENSAARIAS